MPKKSKAYYLKPFKNLFVVVLVGFSIWMLFFDANSYLIHHELNSDIEDLEDEKDYYRKEIAKDDKEIKELSTEEGMEKLAREKYHMKKEKEEIFIIEYEDSLKNENKE